MAASWPWNFCCTAREPGNGAKGLSDLLPAISPFRKEVEEEPEACDFFECAETFQELDYLREVEKLDQIRFRARSYSKSSILTTSTTEPEREPSISGRQSSVCSGSSSGLEAVGTKDLAEAMALLEATRQRFQEAYPKEGKDCPEMEWANLGTARRMVQACEGDDDRARRSFFQAMELRLRDREVYTTLVHEKHCDLRIIGHDKHHRPVIYFCAHNQRNGIRAIRDQLLAHFEGACRMAEDGDGQINFVVDMYGLRPTLFSDYQAIKDLAQSLGAVFAERIHRIVIVDFSSAAQTIWWMLKPFLSPVTQRKFSFSSFHHALQLCRDELDEETAKRVQASMEVNRDEDASSQSREKHAELTTVPLPRC